MIAAVGVVSGAALALAAWVFFGPDVRARRRRRRYGGWIR